MPPLSHIVVVAVVVVVVVAVVVVVVCLTAWLNVTRGRFSCNFDFARNSQLATCATCAMCSAKRATCVHKTSSVAANSAAHLAFFLRIELFLFKTALDGKNIKHSLYANLACFNKIKSTNEMLIKK